MSNPSEFSLFGKKPGKNTKRDIPENIPAQPQAHEPMVSASDLPAAADALAALFPSDKSATQTETVNAAELTPARVAPVDLAPEIIDIDHLTLDQIEAFFPSENVEPKEEMKIERIEKIEEPKSSAYAGAASAKKAAPPSSPKADAPHAAERRAKRRALISAPVRVRSIDLTTNSLDDITTTMNVSRIGILLASKNPAYYRSMDVMVTFPHSNSPSAMQAEQPGRVVRISEMPDGRRSVAIALGVTHRQDEEFISSSGEKLLAGEAPALAQKITVERDPNSLRPLVLALDGEASVRESLKSFLAGEGYDVITVTNAQEARDVLSQCTPSLLIAEIEGEGMPGYDICAHCKSTPRLQRVPVMLTTSSAYPSDYASAHSLGAVVCMAKPYRQERLGHVVKLLAPPPNANEKAEPPRPADPSRRHLGSRPVEKATESNVNRRFRFGKKS
jgi:CheY-like chemotaxis protein